MVKILLCSYCIFKCYQTELNQSFIKTDIFKKALFALIFLSLLIRLRLQMANGLNRHTKMLHEKHLALNKHTKMPSPQHLASCVQKSVCLTQMFSLQIAVFQVVLFNSLQECSLVCVYIWTLQIKSLSNKASKILQN